MSRLQWEVFSASSEMCIWAILPSSGISFESKIHYLDLNPEFKFVCEIPVSLKGSLFV